MDITLLLLVLLFALQLIIIVYFYNKFNSNFKKEEISSIKIKELKSLFTEDNNHNNNHNNNNHNNNLYKDPLYQPYQTYQTYQTYQPYQTYQTYYPQSIYRNYPYYNPGYNYIWDPYILNNCSCGGRCNNCMGRNKGHKGNESYNINNNVYIKSPSNITPPPRNIEELKIQPTQPPIMIQATQPPLQLININENKDILSEEILS